MQQIKSYFSELSEFMLSSCLSYGWWIQKVPPGSYIGRFIFSEENLYIREGSKLQGNETKNKEKERKS